MIVDKDPSGNWIRDNLFNCLGKILKFLIVLLDEGTRDVVNFIQKFLFDLYSGFIN